MRYCDWDEVLDRDGLLILTEEALTPPRRSRAPLRRLAAAAACAGLVLGLMNYRAVAAGVGSLPLFRRHRRHGGRQGGALGAGVSRSPDGGITHEADATLRSGVLELELTMSSPYLPIVALSGEAGGPVGGRGRRNAVHTITPYSVADAEGAATPLPPEQGYQTTASTRLLYDGRSAAGRSPSMSAVWASRGECSPSDWCRRRRPPRYRRLGRSPRGI
ncbi:MAG: hypothetical protein ACLS63_03220 [Flavonifractor plautii]